MRPHHLDTNSYPQPLSNPTWVPIYPIFLPLPPQTPDSFPPPKTHRVSPLTPVLPPLCCLGFSLPEGGLRKPASAGALGNSPKGGGGGWGCPCGNQPQILLSSPPHPTPIPHCEWGFVPLGVRLCWGGSLGPPHCSQTALAPPLVPPPTFLGVRDVTSTMSMSHSTCAQCPMGVTSFILVVCGNGIKPCWGGGEEGPPAGSPPSPSPRQQWGDSLGGAGPKMGQKPQKSTTLSLAVTQVEEGGDLGDHHDGFGATVMVWGPL